MVDPSRFPSDGVDAAVQCTAELGYSAFKYSTPGAISIIRLGLVACMWGRWSYLMREESQDV